MAIERMEHVAVLAPASMKGEAANWLYGRREMHVMGFEGGQAWDERFTGLMEDSTRADIETTRLQFVTSFLRKYSAQRPDFLSSLFPVKIVAVEEEISRAVADSDTKSAYSRCQALASEIDAAVGQRAALIAERERLRELDFIRVDLARLRSLRHVAVRFVAVPEAAEGFLADDRVDGRITAQAGVKRRGSSIYILAAAPADARVLSDVISEWGLRELPLPPIEGTVGGALQRIEAELAAADQRAAAARSEAAVLARDLRRHELALAWWESERTRISEQARMVSSGAVFASRGYVRRAALDTMRRDVEGRFPGASVIPCAAPTGEEPPVSLKWSRFVRPAGLLVRMFGLPRYTSFDPTPYLMLAFFTFFGICFGDLAYGLMLLGVAAYLKRRFRSQRHLVEFFRLFTYAALTTMVFGVLTGSWASDLTMYLGEGNTLDRIRVKLTLLDPLQKPMVALGIAVGIGVVNQAYGLILKFLSSGWKGDWRGGFYDGGLWLIYLASLLSAAFSAAGVLPPAVASPALVVFAAAAVGLVLTQGRDQKTWGMRLLVGVVSLYGILGGYGTTSFIGDVLSYSRLLALGMTTTVIGMSFNIVAGFVKMVPVAGVALFVLVCLFGHMFNFVMSILGSFVHPARLMFLEFFGRFYEGGGAAFRPFGFRSAAVDIAEAPR